MIGLISAAHCNVDVVDEQSRVFKIRSSLDGPIVRNENQVSHCALNQVTHLLIEAGTKA
jgi:hypothetical protein